MAPRKRRPGFLSPAYLLRSQAIKKGVFGNDPLWRGIAAFIFGRRFLKKTFGRQPEVLVNETLQPGESMTIRTIEPPTAKESRRGRRRR